jgi:glycosyl transferase, family 25
MPDRAYGPPCFVINLDGSHERLAGFASAADAAGLRWERIAAIDGRKTVEADWREFDVKKFGRVNGRLPMPGEYGCYASHVKALRRFLDMGVGSCVVFEDDARPEVRTRTVLDELARTMTGRAVLIRLVVHRNVGFEPLMVLPSGDRIGQSWFGPNGSAAAYFVTREAAAQLLTHAVPGRMPFDVFLERPFQHGVPSLILEHRAVPVPNTGSSDIYATAISGKHEKWSAHKRFGALSFRGIQLIRRLIHCALQRRF